VRDNGIVKEILVPCRSPDHDRLTVKPVVLSLSMRWPQIAKPPLITAKIYFSLFVWTPQLRNIKE